MTASPHDAPLLDVSEAAALVRRWRQEPGCRVAFANGCFDLLHVGHVRYLNAAREHADRLVVGVNGDARVRALKGAGRPLYEAAARASVLAGLRCIDAVVIFEEPTADALIAALQPDFHCKGTDYEAGVPEAATVESYGGRVLIVGDDKDHGSSDLIARIRRLS